MSGLTKSLNAEQTAENSPGIRFLIAFAGLILVGLLGFTDYKTGAELSFSIFYLFPVLFVTWRAGLFYGIAISLISAVTWYYSDISTHEAYSHVLIPIWNAAVRFGFFLFGTYMLTSLRKALDREKALALTDPLTGAANARLFYMHAENEIERMRRSKKPLSAAYIDVDNFKTVNDTMGHSAGDSLLRVVACTLCQGTRSTDITGRLGGDEFAILLPETDNNGADVLINKLRDSLTEAMRLSKWPVTFSIGIATFASPPESVNDLIKKADDLMYSVKNTSKNNVQRQIF